MHGSRRSVQVHDLLHIAQPLRTVMPVDNQSLPAWAVRSLTAAPWVVVRRAAGDEALAVGIRGSDRGERLAAHVTTGAVRQVVRPHDLPRRAAGIPAGRRTAVPALAALLQALPQLNAYQVRWGPGGSVGFELATGVPTARSTSDLDLVIEARAPVSRDAATRLLAILDQLPVRADALLETPYGAVSLAEYARSETQPVLTRTADGPRLTTNPWRPPARNP